MHNFRETIDAKFFFFRKTISPFRCKPKSTFDNRICLVRERYPGIEKRKVSGHREEKSISGYRQEKSISGYREEKSISGYREEKSIPGYRKEKSIRVQRREKYPGTERRKASV